MLRRLLLGLWIVVLLLIIGWSQATANPPPPGEDQGLSTPASTTPAPSSSTVQTPPTAPAPRILAPTSTTRYIQAVQDTRFMQGLLVLLFGLAVLASITYLTALTHKKVLLQPEDIMRMFGLVLIILGSVYLVTAQYADVEVAPVMGLFGTIAGYLLRGGQVSTNEETPFRPDYQKTPPPQGGTPKQPPQVENPNDGAHT